MRQHAHQIAGLEFDQGRLLRIDFVAEDPKMSGVQTPILVALQPQYGQLRHMSSIGHEKGLKRVVAVILTD